MRILITALPALFAAIVLSGCSQQPRQLGPEMLAWPARDSLVGDLNGGGGLATIQFATDIGNWDTVNKVAASEEFAKRVDEFAQADGPAGRTAERDVVTQNLRKLIEAGKSNAAPDALKAACKAVSESLKAAATKGGT